MSEKKQYSVNADGWVAGKWQKKGDLVSMTPDQAKYENVTPIVIGIDLATEEDETVTFEVPNDKGKAKNSKGRRSGK